MLELRAGRYFGVRPASTPPPPLAVAACNHWRLEWVRQARNLTLINSPLRQKIRQVPSRRPLRIVGPDRPTYPRCPRLPRWVRPGKARGEHLLSAVPSRTVVDRVCQYVRAGPGTGIRHQAPEPYGCQMTGL